MAKNLIIYYSRKGQNYVNGSIKLVKKADGWKLSSAQASTY